MYRLWQVNWKRARKQQETYKKMTQGNYNSKAEQQFP
jgi:hypothetical protein